MSVVEVSICTVAMNRKDHVVETIIKNIEDNIESEYFDYNILDYNSDDDLGAWVQENCKDYIDRGILKYFRTEEPKYFDRAHSRNMIMRLAEGNVVCNLDADNFLGGGFVNYTKNIFQENREVLLVADTQKRYYFLRNAFGRFCVNKDRYMEIGGIDEKLVGYGAETIDLYNRLLELNLKETVILPEYLDTIAHDDDDRTKNEYFINNIHSIAICYASHEFSQVLLLYKDNNYRLGQICQNENGGGLSVKLDTKGWEEGVWSSKTEESTITVGEKEFSVRNNGNNEMYILEGQEYYIQKAEQFIKKASKEIPFITNINDTKVPIRKGQKINENGFGKGRVFKNFSSEAIFLD